MSFVHLHNHSTYSELDGAGFVDDYVRKAAEDGNPAIASSDHGNLYALPDYEKACKEYGIKYIPGIEAYQARNTQLDRPKTRGKSKESGDDSGTGKLYHHVCLYARNQAGLRNMYELTTDAWLEGFYYKPRTDWKKMEQYSEGMFATSGCLGGVILQEIMHGNNEAARQAIGNFVDIYGRDDFYIELQDHGIPEQTATNPVLLEFAKEFNLRTVATNDCHYLNHSDHDHHDTLLCCQTRSQKSDQDRFKFSSDQHYLKSATEMSHLFREVPEAITNTLWVAERVEPITIIDSGSYHLPHFQIPKNFFDDDEYLRHLVEEGIASRYGADADREDIVARMNFELETMRSADMAGYFLVVWDIINFAKSQAIKTGPGRGSAAGSIIAYALGITDIDPIKYGLIFERFYNPDRKGLPDIDLDIDTRYRETLINYCAEKYGHDKVAQIVTFGRIASKSAIKDVARVLGHPPKVGDDLTKKVPPDLFGRTIPLKEALAETPSAEWADQWRSGGDLRAEMTNQDSKMILEGAMGIEGLMKTTGVHAAAVIITPEPAVSYVPLMRKKKDGPVTTSFEMGPVEEAGLVKMDFLGLKNLDIISDTEALIGREADATFADEATYQNLAQGNGIAVFQLESGPMRSLMKQLKPETFGDLAALIALYRPGPMGMDLHTQYAMRKNGAEPTKPIHPDSEDLLGDTYQLMIYQEQMMEVAKRFAGYSMADADSLRKATGKKILSLMASHKEKFWEGCIDNGYDESVAKMWWNIIEPFASYSFNKSHAYAYGAISYQTAWLKTHYPVEYLSSILNANKDDLSGAALYLAEADRIGISVLPPSVNKSEVDFSPASDKEIRFGLSAIREVGPGPATAIVDERGSRGSFKNYENLRSRVPMKQVNRKSMFALTASGSMDELGSRGGLLEIFDDAFASAKAEQKALEAGAVSLFEIIDYDDSIEVPEVELKPTKIRELEREYLGISITSNPLLEWRRALTTHGSEDIAEIQENSAEGDIVSVAAVVTNVREWRTKKGDTMATVTLQDFTGIMDMLIFNRLWQTVKPKLDQAIVVKAKVADDGEKLLAQTITMLDPNHKAEDRSSEDCILSLSSSSLTESNVEELKKALSNPAFKGSNSVKVRITDSGQLLDLNMEVDKTHAILNHMLRKLFQVKEVIQ